MILHSNCKKWSGRKQLQITMIMYIIELCDKDTNQMSRLQYIEDMGLISSRMLYLLLRQKKHKNMSRAISTVRTILWALCSFDFAWNWDHGSWLWKLQLKGIAIYTIIIVIIIIYFIWPQNWALYKQLIILFHFLLFRWFDSFRFLVAG